MNIRFWVLAVFELVDGVDLKYPTISCPVSIKVCSSRIESAFRFCDSNCDFGFFFIVPSFFNNFLNGGGRDCRIYRNPVLRLHARFRFWRSDLFDRIADAVIFNSF